MYNLPLLILYFTLGRGTEAERLKECGEIFKFPSGRKRRFPVKWEGWRTWLKSRERSLLCWEKTSWIRTKLPLAFLQLGLELCPYEAQFSLAEAEEDSMGLRKEQVQRGTLGEGICPGAGTPGRTFSCSRHSPTQSPQPHCLVFMIFQELLFKWCNS